MYHTLVSWPRWKHFRLPFIRFKFLRILFFIHVQNSCYLHNYDSCLRSHELVAFAICVYMCLDREMVQQFNSPTNNPPLDLFAEATPAPTTATDPEEISRPGVTPRLKRLSVSAGPRQLNSRHINFHLPFLPASRVPLSLGSDMYSVHM